LHTAPLIIPARIRRETSTMHPSLQAFNLAAFLIRSLVVLLPVFGVLSFGASVPAAAGFALTAFAAQFLVFRIEKIRMQTETSALADIRQETLHLRRIARQNKMVFNAVGEGIMGLDQDLHVTFFNTAAERLTGRREGECVGLHRDQIIGNVGLFFDGRKRTAACEGILPRLAGEPIPVEYHFSPVYENNQPIGSIIMFRDMREHRRANETQQLAATVLEWSAQAIVVTDLSGIIITINPAFTQLTGFLSQDTLGHHISFLRSDRHDDEFYTNQWELLHKDGVWGGEMWNRRHDGSLFAAWVNMTRISEKEDDTGFLVGFYFDITDRKNHEELLIQAANHDTLTALPNRRLFQQYLIDAIRIASDQRVFSLMLIDLDGFKEINDQYGHAAGDLTLKTVARRMSRLLRGHDIVARLGGDEFTVLLPNNGLETAKTVASKLIEAISAPISNAGTNLRVSASIGIAGYPGDGETADALMRAADTAMYAVKHNGKHGFLLFNSMVCFAVDQPSDWKHLLEEAFHHEEIEVRYQPLVDLDTLCVAGFESCYYWQRTDGTRMSAEALLPLINDAGLTSRLTIRVMEQTVDMMSHWLGKKVPLLTAIIFLSRAELETDSYLATLTGFLAESGTNPGRIEVNIPEALFELSETEPFIKALAAFGIRFSIDDFSGTRIELDTLTDLRPVRIKLSPSFMAAFFDEDPLVGTQLKSIVSLAASHNIYAVATDIRTPDQLQTLCSTGCRYIQGPIISHAICGDDTCGFINNFNQIFSLEIIRNTHPLKP
jgi:diguanylate cyclase (GGDEF)-like protein/PAS domain S-box-containing protein